MLSRAVKLPFDKRMLSVLLEKSVIWSTPKDTVKGVSAKNLKKMMEMQDAEDPNLLADTVDSSIPVVDEQAAAIPEARVPDYIPFLDNPPVQSVGNSGWQVSDIWRDIRLDSFWD